MCFVIFLEFIMKMKIREDLIKENIELKRTMMKFKEDAIRYRYLRDRDLESISNGGVFAGMTPDNFVINGDDLDIAIDKAIEIEKAAGREASDMTDLLCCDICGGRMVCIRGGNPGMDSRNVCPICMAETLDDIKSRLSDNYEQAYQAT